MATFKAVASSLICNVQALGVEQDCDQPLVSDGEFWRCPYGHIQGFDDNLQPIRAIPDMRLGLR